LSNTPSWTAAAAEAKKERSPYKKFSYNKFYQCAAMTVALTVSFKLMSFYIYQ